MEYIDLKLERNVLSCVFFHRDMLLKIVNKGTFPIEAFADKSIRNIYKIVLSFFNHNGKMITEDLLLKYISRYSKSKKNAALFIEKMESVVDKVLAHKPSDSDIDLFDTHVSELIIMLNARMMQEYQMALFEKVDANDIDGAKDLINTFKLIDEDDSIDKGEYAEDFKEREDLILRKYNNPEEYQLVATGIPKLDEALDGGIDKEFTVIAGHSNDGKSLLTTQIATNMWMMKKNVVFVTIGEMNKNSVQNRIDANIANIEFKFFRNPKDHYDPGIHDQWKSAIERCKKHAGKLKIIEFRKSASVADVLQKAYETMHEWNEPITALIIDSLDNLTAVEKPGVKDWMSYEEICWDTFLITKNFRNHNGISGIPVIATTQLKKANKDISDSSKTRQLREDDVGSSPFQYRYSELFIGMKKRENPGESELQIMKGRGVGKFTGIVCHNNFPVCRYHDPDVEKRHKEELSKAAKAEGTKEIEIEYEGDDE